jgi:hypothetical protein
MSYWGELDAERDGRRDYERYGREDYSRSRYTYKEEDRAYFRGYDDAEREERRRREERDEEQRHEDAMRLRSERDRYYAEMEASVYEAQHVEPFPEQPDQEAE